MYENFENFKNFFCNSSSRIYFLISLIFLIAMIMTMNSCKNIKMKEFNSSFTKKQYDIYKKIVSMRMTDWLEGMFVGFLVSIIIIYLYYNNSKNVDKYTIVGIFVSITFFVNYLYYSLKPKPLWMLNFLNDMNQVDEWLEVYKHMKMRYHLGALLGVIFYLLLSISICYKNN